MLSLDRYHGVLASPLTRAASKVILLERLRTWGRLGPGPSLDRLDDLQAGLLVEVSDPRLWLRYEVCRILECPDPAISILVDQARHALPRVHYRQRLLVEETVGGEGGPARL